MKRITLLAAAGVLVATPVVGAWTAFAATGDNPTATPNLGVHDGGDDRGRHGGEPEPGDHRRDHRHGVDHPTGEVRHGGESEAADDRGSRHESESGDDAGADDRGHDGHHGADDD
jgi:hypothetical protein